MNKNNEHVEVFSARLKLETRSYSEKKIKPLKKEFDDYANNPKFRSKVFSRHFNNPNVLPLLSDRANSKAAKCLSNSFDEGRFDEIYNKRFAKHYNELSPDQPVKSHRDAFRSDRSPQSEKSPISIYYIGRRNSPTNETSPLNIVDRKES